MNLTHLPAQNIIDSEICLTETEKIFSSTLKKIAQPLTLWTKIRIIYFSSEGQQITVSSEECSCADEFFANQHFSSEVYNDNLYLGRVVLCGKDNDLQAESTLESLIDLAKNELNRIEDEEALLAELSASWESLQAVYDLNADFNSFDDPNCLLKKITERTKAIHGELRAVLWLEKGAMLEPSAANYPVNLSPRAKDQGLIGSVFTKKQSAIYNEPERLIVFDEPEFSEASCAALIPLTTRLKTYGVMVVWLEIENFSFDSRRMRLLDTLALQAAMVAENDRLHRESIQNAKLNKEIEIGSKIQQTLLSGTPPQNLRGIEIAAASISSQKIDGDFYDFIEYGADCFDLIIGDVMGKGIPAALVGAATKSSFLRAIGSLQTSENNLRPATEKIVGFVNRDVTPKLMRFESFVTACYTRFDLEKSEITFVDCGHTKTIHYDSQRRKINLLEGENLPLGFAEHEIFVEKSLDVRRGDVLFFYSDGVTETKNPQGELFGDQRLEEFIRHHSHLQSEKIISTLIETLYEFSEETKFNDDLTCVAVRIVENS